MIGLAHGNATLGGAGVLQEAKTGTALTGALLEVEVEAARPRTASLRKRDDSEGPVGLGLGWTWDEKRARVEVRCLGVEERATG